MTYHGKYSGDSFCDKKPNSESPRRELIGGSTRTADGLGTLS